ncbi:hypothetical protein OY671_011185, partial [Metschnikowia pulcherrima]
PVASSIFETFDAFDQARLALRDGGFVKFGEETGPVEIPNYGAYRFTRVAGATPDAPDSGHRTRKKRKVLTARPHFLEKKSERSLLRSTHPFSFLIVNLRPSP